MNGHNFTRAGVSGNDFRWKCSHYRRFNCKAKFISDENGFNIRTVSLHHNHQLVDETESSKENMNVTTTADKNGKLKMFLNGYYIKKRSQNKYGQYWRCATAR